ncbi:MAG: hypothetical protein LV481_16425 [Methylacidiphilales bacterium]|nr:hypothetical protein [Candidatus Methylacidiphilales bacterium]
MKSKPGSKPKHNGQLGKIRSLPYEIRTEINRRIDAGHIMQEIADWVNAQPEVRAILDEKWDGQLVGRHVIAHWRNRGYQEWRRERLQIENLKELSEYALKLGQAAGGSIADGSAAIAGGRIMSILETASDEEVLKMVRPIVELRASDFNKARLSQNDKKIEQSNKKLAQYDQKLELERQRFQLQSTELFLKWYADKKARDIVESRAGNREKIEKLGRVMFGEAWRC